MSKNYRKKMFFIITIMWMGLFFSTYPSHGSDLFSPEQQLEKLIELKETRKPSDIFPELKEVFLYNIGLVEAALHTPVCRQLFKETVTFIQGTCWDKSFDQSLLSYNMAYHLLSFILSLDQLGDGQKKKQVMSNFEKMKFFFRKIHTLTIKEALEYPLFENYFCAAQVNLYPLFVFTETGIMPIDLLNKSFAHRTPLCGIPLKRSSYDGYFLELSEDFLAHDTGHISFEQGYIYRPEKELDDTLKDEFVLDYEYLNTLYNVYSDLYHQIDKMKQCEEMRQLDHFCLFFLGHETFFAMDRHKMRRFSKEKAKKNVIRYFKDLLISPLEPFLLSTGEKKSLYQLIIDFSLPKNQQCDFQEVLQLYECNGVLLTKIREYNYIYDVQTMLKLASITIPVWDDETELYIAEKTISYFSKIFDNFYEKYM